MTSESDVADRIQKRILSETRQKLAEAERKLKVCEGQVERLVEVISTKQSVMDQKIKEAEEQLAMVAEKDLKIVMLQNRLASLNDEYNGLRRGKRGATTLEDVYKMTGQGQTYIKDGEDIHKV